MRRVASIALDPNNGGVVVLSTDGIVFQWVEGDVWEALPPLPQEGYVGDTQTLQAEQAVEQMKSVFRSFVPGGASPLSTSDLESLVNPTRTCRFDGCDFVSENDEDMLAHIKTVHTTVKEAP